jgi:hypothetical protein
MKNRYFKLFLIQLGIWFVYLTSELLYWFYNQSEDLGYIFRYKLFQFLIPGISISLIIVLLYSVSVKFAQRNYLKITFLLLNIIISFVIYFYIVSFHFKYIWVEKLHTISLSHFLLAGKYYWLLFVVLNTTCFAYNYWIEYRKQKHIIAKLLDEKKENRHKSLTNDSILYLSGKMKGSSLQINSIKFIQADTYISNVIIDNNKRIAFNRSLKKWEEVLPKENFLRIHKSFIVNIDYIDTIKKLQNQTYEVLIKDYISPIQMSRRVGKELYLNL